MTHNAYPTITLGRDGIAAEAGPAEFCEFVTMVCCEIDQVCGFGVDVVVPPHDAAGAQYDRFDSPSQVERDTMRAKLGELWARWLEQEEVVRDW
jgi:hypothetical protein